jgi:hypothetical protein
MAKRYTMVLNFGYVESASLSYLPFTSNKSYPNAKDALVDLATFLKEQYLLGHSTKPKACCIASKAKDIVAEFCAKCGKSLKEKGFDVEAFQTWLSDISGCTADSLGEFIEYDDEHHWQSNGLEVAPNPRIVYQAAWVIAAALGHYHRPGITFDTICNNRTKSKQNSFSYFA